MRDPVAIVVRRDQQLVSSHRLEADVLKVGRLESSHIQLEDDVVSRMHAVIEKRDGGWRIIDLGSSVGTTVGGRAVSAAPLAVGDVIGIGPFTLEVVLADKLGGVAPPKPDPAPRKQQLQCPSCRSTAERVATEIQTEMKAPDLTFDSEDVLTRLRAEICPDCGYLSLFVRDPAALVP